MKRSTRFAENEPLAKIPKSCSTIGFTSLKHENEDEEEEEEESSKEVESDEDEQEEEVETALKSLKVVQNGIVLPCNLTAIDLRGETVSTEDFVMLIQSLQHNASVKELLLSSTLLENLEACLIADLLITNNCSVEFLSLSGNRISDHGAVQLSKALFSNSNLTHLDLSDNKISDVGANSFAAALMSNSSLTSLNLSWNFFSQKATEKLVDALASNTTITDLYVGHLGTGSSKCCHTLSQKLEANRAWKLARDWPSSHFEIPKAAQTAIESILCCFEYGDFPAGLQDVMPKIILLFICRSIDKQDHSTE